MGTKGRKNIKKPKKQAEKKKQGSEKGEALLILSSPSPYQGEGDKGDGVHKI